MNHNFVTLRTVRDSLSQSKIWKSRNSLKIFENFLISIFLVPTLCQLFFFENFWVSIFCWLARASFYLFWFSCSRKNRKPEISPKKLTAREKAWISNLTPFCTHMSGHLNKFSNSNLLFLKIFENFWISIFLLASAHQLVPGVIGHLGLPVGRRESKSQPLSITN